MVVELELEFLRRTIGAVDADHLAEAAGGDESGAVSSEPATIAQRLGQHWLRALGIDGDEQIALGRGYRDPSAASSVSSPFVFFAAKA